MKRVSILVLVLFTCLVKGQDFEIKQITSGNFDARNPVTGRYYFWDANKIFYEVHTGNSINIYSSDYNPETDSFSDTIAVTTGNFQNINPVPDYNDGLIFLTNQNGNWDIAHKKYENGVWSETQFLTNTPEDETNLREIFSEPYSWELETHLIFERDGSVFYLYVDSSEVFEETVFQKSSELSYDQSAGAYNLWSFAQQEGLHIAAVETDQNQIKRIVSRHRNLGGNWAPLDIVLDTCSCSNLIFQPVDYYPSLVFEDTSDTTRKLMGIPEWQTNKIVYPLIAENDDDQSAFKSAVSYIVTEPPSGKTDFYFYHPHAYLLKNSESTRIRLNLFDVDNPSVDSIYSLKVTSSNTDVGSVGFYFGYEVFYTLFEDSIDGNVHLFGRKFLNPVGAVDDDVTLTDFTLYQNYPNPFNPVTKIKWSTQKGSRQSLRIYDVLGNEVATLVNEYKPIGDYQVEFDASDLSSGIYFYRLQVGDRSFSRKMILLK
ncbi:MAG: T9SS type A sorting domain-containing protein [Ignavibacteriales bacterium]|nr:MAG: T9SS type A sorting domain-containing protein [Ignavibacteriales bacterium]